VTRKEPAFPSYWVLQTIGWLGFWLLVLVASIPSLKDPGELRDSAVFVCSMFGVSCLLHPLCRSLVRRPLSFLALEIRAFACSLMAGAAAATATDIITIGRNKLVWAVWLGDFIQSSVVLFLWCSLYFGIHQWRQATQERERSLRAESAAPKRASTPCAIS
jgi:hypothetical protein